MKLDNCIILTMLPLLCPSCCEWIVLAYVAVHEQLKEQIKDVGAAQSKQVSVFWVGMAEVNTSKIDFHILNENLV